MNQETENIQKRLKILGDDEIEAIYGKPHFTEEERAEYFSITPVESAAMEQMRYIKTRIYYILQLGYFKAHHLFFVFTHQKVEEDVNYIKTQYFSDFQFTDIEITKATRLKQRQLILSLYDYRMCGAKERQQLKEQALSLAKVSSKPIYIFRELIKYLAEKKIVVPGYSSLQKIIGNALTYEQNRLRTIIGEQLQGDDIIALNALLDDSQGLYEITLLKREPKDFTLSEIKREIERGDQIRHLYYVGQRVLPLLAISNDSITYYASLVIYYSVFRLKQLDERMVYIYLLCFVYHRYQRINDNLINCLLSKIREYYNYPQNVDQVLRWKKEVKKCESNEIVTEVKRNSI